MKINRLLEQHQKTQAQGLPENLGDGYLMQHNRVYKGFREAALKAGYKFTRDRDEAYETFPLLQLPQVLKNRKIPYFNNVAALNGLTPVQLEALSWEDIDGNLKKNFVFHEACHGVVRALALKTMGPVPEGGDLESQRKLVLRMLLEESCANTCELIGMIEAADPTHRIFFEMNSYICLFENRTNLKNTMDDLGREVVISWMLLSYLQSNFLRHSLEDSEFQKMLNIVTDKKLTPQQIKNLRAQSKIAFLLSERFRVQTTSFHLRLAGIKTLPKTLFDFDFLKELSNNKGFPAFVREFVSIF